MELSKTWIFREIPRPESILQLTRALGISPILATLLLQRGIATPQDAEAFLKPSLDRVLDPFAFKDMDIAVNRLGQAMARKESVGVYGDYDVDGVCSTVIVSDFLSKAGLKVLYKTPNRLNDGYGLSVEGLQQFKDRHIRLVVACDLGSRDHRALAYAKDAGLEVIVLDHHEPPCVLPPSLALVNPKRQDCPSGQRGACSTALAFYFVLALNRSWVKAPSSGLLPYLDLVALATLADRAPLIQDNRTLTKIGLERLTNTHWVGLKELKRLSLGNPLVSVSEKDANFVLIPRLNASGRMGAAKNTLKLLLSKDSEEAKSLVQKIEAINKDRKRLQNGILEEAMQKALVWVEQDAPAIVVWGKGWNHGVAGIVAAKLAERFHRPAIVLECCDGGILKGSGRSVPGVSLLAALENVKEHLKRCGGHRSACGLTLHEDRLPDFLKGLMATLALSSKNETRLWVDLSLKGLPSKEEWLASLEPLSPFGEGNPYPQILISPVHLHGVTSQQTKPRLTLEDGTIWVLQRQWGATFCGTDDSLEGLGQALLEVRPVKRKGFSFLEVLLKDFRSLESSTVTPQ